jgi:probable rRNA maturation factor
VNASDGHPGAAAPEPGAPSAQSEPGAPGPAPAEAAEGAGAEGRPPDPAGERGVEVFLADEQSDVAVDAVRLARLAQRVLEKELPGPIVDQSQVSLLFVDEATIADLHGRFLDGDGPTDVLAFPIDDDAIERGRQPDQGGRGPGGPTTSPEIPVLLGDVVVCPAVARRQAEERDAAVEDELALLVVHGVLHLLRYDHEDDEQRLVMEERQREHLALWPTIPAEG